MVEGGDDFNIDRQEYQSVFKVFDKNGTGEINISQVYELINKFDQAAKVSDPSGAGEALLKGGGGGPPGGGTKNTGGSSVPDSSIPTINVIGASGTIKQ